MKTSNFIELWNDDRTSLFDWLTLPNNPSDCWKRESTVKRAPQSRLILYDFSGEIVGLAVQTVKISLVSVRFVYFPFILWFNENTSENINNKNEHVHQCSLTWTNSKQLTRTLGHSEWFRPAQNSIKRRL